MNRRVLLLVFALALVATPAGAVAAGIPKGIPESKLALMPLPRTAFGPAAATLNLDADESGVVDNAEAADDTTKAKDTAASLAAAGRLTGYDVSFTNFNLFDRPGNLVSASSDVSLYVNEAKAKAGIAESLRDVVADDPGSGFVVVSSKRFAAPGLGPGAQGIHVAAKVGAVKVWFTGVIFQRRELVVTVALVRTDATDQSALALQIARAAQTRVEGVLDGSITTPAAKVPATQTETPAKPGKPGKPKVEIAGAALAPADLNGAKPTRQEYVPDDDAIASYEREFDDVKFGGTPFLNIETDVGLHASAAEAAVYLGAIRGVLNPTNPSFKNFITAAFEQGAGFSLRSYSVRRYRTFKLPGTAGVELVLRLVTPLGRLDAAFVYMASGRFVGAMYAISMVDKALGFADVNGLEAAFAKRMQAAGVELTQAR